MKRLNLMSILAAAAMLFGLATASTVAAQSQNLALGKIATQSTDIGPPFNASDGLAFKAVDGNTDGNWNGGSVTSTACTIDSTNECRGTTDPWWQVDLGTDFVIDRIQIWNRTDCCKERLNNFRIWVKSSTGGWENFISGSGLHTFNPGEQYPLTFQGSKQARFVRVQLVNPSVILSLAEVMVFGSPVPTFGPSNPSSPGNSADEQFWNVVKDSSKAQDFQSYLSAFPNGQFAALARFKMNNLSGSTAGTGTTSGNSTVDEQFWNMIKDSTKPQDFQSYLSAFPNGQFAALARFKMNNLTTTTTTTPPTSNSSLTIDEQFWNTVKNSNNPRDFQSYLDNFPNGQFVALARFNRDRLGGVGPGTVTPPTNSGPSRNAAFLNQLAATNRAKLPITVGDIQLFDSFSVCQSGCQQTANTESVVIRARTPNLSNQRVSIGQVEQSLKSAMLKGYCGSPEQASNVTIDIDVDDMFNQKIGHFFITSRDCGGSGTSANPPLPTKPSTTQFQQVIAAAQPGSISEIARARKFFVVSNDFSIKSKISSAMIKALPQMQAASTEQEADFFIGFELTDRTTGLVTPNDGKNPNLRGELIVFTVIPATPNRPENIRILFRVTKERGFGVFSATPDENAAKEFAKQLAKVII